MQETIHLLARFDIRLYLTYNTFLRIGEIKGEAGLVEGIEVLANNRHREAFILLTSLHLTQDLHLDIEELLELHPFPCPLHGNHIAWEMNITECFAKPHEMVFLHDIHAQCVWQTLLTEMGDELRHDGTNRLGVHSCTFHTLSGVVVWL